MNILSLKPCTAHIFNESAAVLPFVYIDISVRGIKLPYIYWFICVWYNLCIGFILVLSLLRSFCQFTFYFTQCNFAEQKKINIPSRILKDFAYFVKRTLITVFSCSFEFSLILRLRSWYAHWPFLSLEYNRSVDGIIIVTLIWQWRELIYVELENTENFFSLNGSAIKRWGGGNKSLAIKKKRKIFKTFFFSFWGRIPLLRW